jgi:hypothetical protein
VSGLRRIGGNGLALLFACVSAVAVAGARAQTDESSSALAEQLMQLLTQTGIQLPGALPGADTASEQQGAPPSNPTGVANPYSWELTPEQRGYRPPAPSPTTPAAVPVDGSTATQALPAAQSSAPLPPQTIYLWRDRNGRAFYTNSAEQIPELERERAKVDLSRISLNTELGTELNRRLEQRYTKLASSPKCAELRQAAELGFLEHMWADYAPLLICGGLLLLFLLFTPRAVHHFGGTAWSRTLMMAIPALAVAGVLTFSMRETNLALIELKHKAMPCEQGTFAAMGSSPDAVLRRAALVRHLQAMVLPPAPQ